MLIRITLDLRTLTVKCEGCGHYIYGPTPNVPDRCQDCGGQQKRITDEESARPDFLDRWRDAKVTLQP